MPETKTFWHIETPEGAPVCVPVELHEMPIGKCGHIAWGKPGGPVLCECEQPWGSYAPDPDGAWELAIRQAKDARKAAADAEKAAADRVQALLEARTAAAKEAQDGE